ncbi:MAG: PAS domain S-box protein, partial [Coriobacteriia bacterium]
MRVRISELTTEQVAGRLNDILLLMTLDGRILDVNEAGLKAYGYTLEELRTMDIRDLRTPEEQERAGAQMRTAALEGILFESEHHSKGGVIFPVQVRSARVEVDGQSALFSVIRDITDSKRMQDVLSERNARLAVIVEGAGVGTWEWNVQTGELVINERWARIIGFTLDELAPVSVETWEKYGHPDDLIRSGELLDLHFAGELEYYDFECRMRHKDGHWVWVRDRGRVLTRTAAGEPLIMVGTHTDITEFKHADEELRRERKMFAHAEAVAHIGSWRMSLGDREVVWSDEIYRIFGLDRATYQGDLNSAARDAVHPDDIERFMAASNAVRDGEEILALSAVRIIRPDGEIRWIVGSAEEELDADGRAIALLGFAQDVTEIVDAQAAIEAREATTSSLLDAITESAFLMAGDGTILAANKVVSERVGGSADVDLTGKNMYGLLDSDVAAGRRAMVEQVLATGQPVRFEEIRNGRSIVNSLYPVSSVDGAPHIAVFGYDITDLRQGEAALRQNERWLRESQRVAKLGHFVYD